MLCLKQRACSSEGAALGFDFLDISISRARWDAVLSVLSHRLPTTMLAYSTLAQSQNPGSIKKLHIDLSSPSPRSCADQDLCKVIGRKRISSLPNPRSKFGIFSTRIHQPDHPSTTLPLKPEKSVSDGPQRQTSGHMGLTKSMQNSCIVS
jgi:hypothetical protein